jgi:hypothetical protein
MTEANTALMAGLPGDVRALLARPPLGDTRLLELAAGWEGLTPAEARMADGLRLFVVTWDPLEWLVPRPEAVATASAWPLEIVVYVPVWSLVLSEALAVVDPARHGLFAGKAAVALAEAGLADDARAKIAENAERWPDDVRTRMLAGDALDILGDTEAALAHFQAALPLAEQARDYKAIRDLSTRIFRLTRPAVGDSVQRRQPRSRPTRSQRSQRKGRR